MKTKLLLVDAYALLYRSHFAFSKNPRTTSTGINTSSIFGFTNSLLEVVFRYEPQYLGVAFDTGEPSVRHEAFFAYKAHRQAMPEELAAAIPYCHELLEALKIPILSMAGYEADDVIGTIATQAAHQNITVLMFTPDKDYAQLVNDHIFWLRPGNKDRPEELLDRNAVKEKLGISPEQVADWLGLRGDASDNIPGVPKIGEKTALELLQQFQNLEEIIQNTHRITKKSVRETLETNADLGILSKKLATILIDVPVTLDLPALAICDPDWQRLKAILTQLEFKTLSARLTGKYANFVKTITSSHTNNPNPTLFSALPFPAIQNGTSSPQQELFSNTEKNILNYPHQYFLCSTESECEKLVEQALQQPSFCFDTETTSLNIAEAELVALTISFEAGKAYCILFPADDSQTRKKIELFRKIFTNPNCLKIAQNISYDMHILQKYGINVCQPFYDTMLAHYILDSDSKHNMDFLSQKYLSYIPVSIESLIGKKGKKQLSMRHVETHKLVEYACEDADVTLQLYHKFEEQFNLPELHAPKYILENIELPLVPVLNDMESTGIKIDISFLQAYSAELAAESSVLEQTIYELAGEQFNISSPKQLGVILFEKLGIASGKKTPTGQYSTDEEVMQQLLGSHPIVEKLLDYRELIKLRSTYVDALPMLVNSRTGRVHTTYNQAVTSTGRLSSQNPNLQNIPIRTLRGKEIRKAFIAEKGCKLMAADYSQIELRIMAALSQDSNMIAAFAKHADIHTETAAKVFGIPPDQVNAEMRRKAKTINFGIIYGITPFGLAQRLTIKKSEAQAIIDAYFEQFPGIKKYMLSSIEKTRISGYAETMLGRRRYLKDIHSANATIRGFAERNAINAPIQGSAADMIKLAMINLHKTLIKNNLKSKIILQVHDELLLEIPETEIEIVKQIAEKTMVEAMPLPNVPVEVSVGIANNWLDAH